MKVMTFNIWNYTRPWHTRRDMIAQLIEQHRPHVVALQETRHDFRYERGKGQGEQLAELTGYYPTVALGQVYLPILRIDECVTILTREPPLHTVTRRLARLPHEREDENQRVCVGVAVSSSGRTVYAFDTHFSLSARARLSNALEVTRFVREEAGDSAAVLMGDLNAEPQTEPIQFLRGEYEVDGDTGDFLDCWVAAHPHDVGYTYASFGPVRRIDYVLARNTSPDGITAQVIGSESREGVYPSDHKGVVVELPM
ncbi:MAG TPA: endonuclease/exonuclease/phosphatase family protein [Chloroflexota bacterium]